MNLYERPAHIYHSEGKVGSNIMTSIKYELNVDYPHAEEKLQAFRKTLGTEYLKLIREYISNLGISNVRKKEIAQLIQIRLKANYGNNKKD